MSITLDIPKDLISARQAAPLAGVHYSTILAWIQRGVLRGWQRPDGSYRVSAAEVRAVALVPVEVEVEVATCGRTETSARAAAARRRLRERGYHG